MFPIPISSSLVCEPLARPSAACVMPAPAAGRGVPPGVEPSTSWIVEVTFPGKAPVSLRFRTKRKAREVARDFPSGEVRIREVQGYMTFGGWIEVC